MHHIMNLHTLFAYVDPGTGAIIMQVIIAGILGASFMFRRVFAMPLTFFSRLFKSSPPDEESGDAIED